MLVTGGTGFLGKHVVKAVEARGIKAVSTGPYSELYRGGYECHTSAVAANGKYSQGGVVHLAAKCGGIKANADDPAGMMLENMYLGAHVVRDLYCRATDDDAWDGEEVRLINVGTTCSYPADCGESANEEQLYQGEPDAANRPYGLAKRWVCQAVETCNTYNPRFFGTNLILANLYGPGDHYERERSHVIPGMIKAFDDGLQGGPVRLWGTGEPRREFLFVEDAAEAIAIAACADKPFRGTYNVGSGEIVSMRELANMIKATMGYDGPVIWDTSKPDGQTTRGLDSSKWRRESLWSHKTTLREGLERTVQDYRARSCEAVHAS